MCNSKAVKISPNQHASLPRFLFTAVPLKIQKKDVILVSRPLFYRVFYKKTFCDVT